MPVPGKASPLATILVVDDIATNRNLLEETLEKENYEVLLAPTARPFSKSRGRPAPTSSCWLS